MKLLYTLTAYPPSMGGAQLHTHLLAQEMATRHSVQVVSQWNSNRTDWLLGTTLLAPGHDNDYRLDGIDVHQMGLPFMDKVRVAPWALVYYAMMAVAVRPIAACLERHLYPYAERADLVHNVRIGREGLSYASLQAARRCDIPFVLTPVHHPRWVGWRYRAYLKLYTMADTVLALTSVEKEVLVGLGVREDRVVVTGIGPVLAPQADAHRFLSNHCIDGPMVLFLGQHFHYKGYLQVLQAAPLVWRTIPETHFVFVGPPVGRSERVFEASKDRRIHRLGAVDLQEKTDALSACTLLCMPSTQESFGGVYTEAWSFAKPVIGCNIPAVSDVVSDGVDGYLVPQDSRVIAHRIVHLLLHPSVAQAMGEAGKRKVDKHYVWERLARVTEGAYRKAIGSA